MKLLFYLGHPAHYHLFKNAIRYFKGEGQHVTVLIKKKDVLEDLLDADGIPYRNIFPKTRGNSHFEMGRTIMKRNALLFQHCLRNRPDLLIGTSVENSHIGKVLGIPSINVNEDDHDVVPMYSKFSYPLSHTILAPNPCSTGRWEYKTIHYKGYHELAYLHPNQFVSNPRITEQYIPSGEPYFLIRFARLNAHHDEGIRGIDNRTAFHIIDKLKAHGRVYITSEKQLIPELEPYRIKINPADMHHIMAGASLYIGDSQTMAAEAGVLGVPFIRYNDFVDRIGYLRELERSYHLGYGISPSDPGKLFYTLNTLLSTPDLRPTFQRRRMKMLREKIDVNQFMIWFIENFPKSKSIMADNPEFQDQFISATIQSSSDTVKIKTGREVLTPGVTLKQA